MAQNIQSIHDVITEFDCTLFAFEYYYEILWLKQSKETKDIIYMVYIKTTQKHSYMYLYWTGERKQDICMYVCVCVCIYIYMSSLIQVTEIILLYVYHELYTYELCFHFLLISYISKIL